MKEYLLIAFLMVGISTFVIALFIIVPSMFLGKKKARKEKVYSLIKNKN